MLINIRKSKKKYLIHIHFNGGSVMRLVDCTGKDIDAIINSMFLKKDFWVRGTFFNQSNITYTQVKTEIEVNEDSELNRLNVEVEE